MMEIQDDPLTLDKLRAHIEKAQADTRAPDAATRAREEIIYMGLRNCIRAGNTECMRDILATWPGFDVNRTYPNWGGLLFYAAAEQLLKEGGEKLRSFGILLDNGADITRSCMYYLSQQHYERPPRPEPFYGTIFDYLCRLEKQVSRDEPMGKLLNSIIYFKDIVIRRQAGPSQPKTPLLQLVESCRYG